MLLLFTSFLAGVLTVLAPCVVAILPALLARSADGKRSHSPYWVIGGLAASVFAFSILLKSTTLLIDIPTSVWTMISGTIIVVFGIVTLFPGLWDRIALVLKLPVVAQQNLAHAQESKRGRLGDVIIGASLGPVFSACSPTYALIVASILPATPLLGIAYLLSYIAGLSLILGLIAIFGRTVIRKLGWGINPHSSFKRVLGIILILLGVLIATGLDKEILSIMVENGWFDWQINLESGLSGQ